MEVVLTPEMASVESGAGVMVNIDLTLSPVKITFLYVLLSWRL